MRRSLAVCRQAAYVTNTTVVVPFYLFNWSCTALLITTCWQSNTHARLPEFLQSQSNKCSYRMPYDNFLHERGYCSRSAACLHPFRSFPCSTGFDPGFHSGSGSLCLQQDSSHTTARFLQDQIPGFNTGSNSKLMDEHGSKVSLPESFQTWACSTA